MDSKNGNIGFNLLIAAIVAVDQMVKYWVDAYLSLDESIPVIPGIFHITYVQNTGAAFSLCSGQAGTLVIFTGLVILLLLAYFEKNAATMAKSLRLCFTLIIAGGAGNLIDRVVRGFVVDFFDFRIWPVFNIADIAICAGCGLLMFYILVLEPRAKKNDKG